MRKLLQALLAVSCVAMWGQATAASVQDALERTPFNKSSRRGMPVSTVAGGESDGRAPTAARQTTAGLPLTAPTSGQFRTFAPSSGSVDIEPAAIGNTTFSAIQNQGLPKATSGGVTMVLRRARVGASFYAEQVQYLFGQVIPLPTTDKNGNVLASPESYWEAEPLHPAGVAENLRGYYWSPNARAVFASQAGPISVTWKRIGASDPPAAADTNKVDYLVSGAAVKPPKRIYWTEGNFAGTGKKISVEPTSVGGVVFAYNVEVPPTVPTEVIPVVPAPEYRTIWYDPKQSAISAYNVEGRIFVEFLGDLKLDGNRKHEGFEIVDLVREPSPSDITIELGDLLHAYADGTSDSDLTPSPVFTQQNSSFVYTHANGLKLEYFAAAETFNLNDFKVHWLEPGVLGILWPVEFTRYKLMWPTDPARYYHYIRPEVATDLDAQQTAIFLPTANAPAVQYQDPLDFPRAGLTTAFKFYTFLDRSHPAHRTLLRLSAGKDVAFQRIFSWLDSGLRDPSLLNGSIAATLNGWNSANPSAQTVFGNDTMTSVRTVNAVAEVGTRIQAPPGEAASDADYSYLPGFIRQSQGTSFSVSAYVDPMASGFAAAAKSAIIPVNSIQGSGKLEVWWFRRTDADTTKGFEPIYWPSVIATYSLQWPSSASEIVLASNDGSGGLNSLQATGHIYYQNDPSQPGYNPNEEHALMQGGQVFALRDDLNIVSGTSYSSQPYVLLEYQDADERPSMRPFHVVRENATDKFDFQVTAGTILQAPMPLPLLERPLAPLDSSGAAISLNTEESSWEIDSNTTGSYPVTVALKKRPALRSYWVLVAQNLNSSGNSIPTSWFLPTSLDPGHKKTTGVFSGHAPYALSAWTLGAQPADTTRHKYAVISRSGLAAGNNIWVADPVTQVNWAVSVADVNTTSGSDYVTVQFANAANATAAANATILLKNDLSNAPSLAGWTLLTEKIPETIPSENWSRIQKFVFGDRKGGQWVYRGPNNPDVTPYLTMQFYYKTLPGFYFPSLPYDAQPAVGAITPYLRPLDNGAYTGDPVYGNKDSNAQEADGNALPIYYRPVWPENVPTLQMAETLTLPKRGLPAVRGQSSMEVFYQESENRGSGDYSKPSVVLQDATREKVFVLGNPGELSEIPISVHTQSYQGKTFFPNLPPHLADRFFFDPARGPKGGLVFKGQFVDSPLGEDYLLLNVMGLQDWNYLFNLVPATDTDHRSLWEAAIKTGLVTDMELYVPDEETPGAFKVGHSTPIKSNELAEITDSDVAVDSYALTAIGPGTGYVTLVIGNGRAFTRSEDPISIQIIRVVDQLYRGELKVVASSNPLGEKVTLQQVVDLAGQINNYEFQWRIASPVDGLPPAVYTMTKDTLVQDQVSVWNHVMFPLATDSISTIHLTPASRYTPNVISGVTAVSAIPFTSFANLADPFVEFTLDAGAPTNMAPGNQVTLSDDRLQTASGAVQTAPANGKFTVSVPQSFEATSMSEAVVPNQPQSILFREFVADSTAIYSQYWLSLNLGSGLGARVYIDGQLAVTANRADGNTTTESPSNLLQTPTLPRTYRLGPEVFGGGIAKSDGTVTHRIAVELFSSALPGTVQAFDLRLEALRSVDLTETADNQWLPVDAAKYQDGVRAIFGDGADVRSLSDNYVIMRYRATDPSTPQWSQWTQPQLVEGWIKRVLAGINPFNQRVSDLFNNRVNTDVSILTEAGPRWEGDVALNIDTINNFGLIEIYETVLHRGRGLSIDAGINYGPANDALLLAAGYLNDLYMMLGNEAVADAANPTIGIGTKDQTYGDIATALFAFKGQVPSLLDEELALLRGRDDSLQPGVETAPVYNRLVWNYTRGIDAGEVIYALNYNILENNDTGLNGVIDADDARRMFPQGHGDAYGHYLTAVKEYYSLLLDPDFDWVPRTEAVSVLGQPVQVDYQDERKFAAAAAALGRTGRQIMELTWREDYNPDREGGWDHLGKTATNSRRAAPTTRYWGVDHWASRTTQGAYLNWVTGNAIVPPLDQDPNHQGIQIIDRTTVPELQELTTIAGDVQASLDNAENGMNPLGLTPGSIAFDINPAQVAGANGQTHFEQVYARAKLALNNALAAFDDAKDVTRMMRSQQDSLADLQSKIGEQELSYRHQLTGIFGSPYPEDIGPGKTYETGYLGPDLVHFDYVDDVSLHIPGVFEMNEQNTYKLDIQQRTSSFDNGVKDTLSFYVKSLGSSQVGEHRQTILGKGADFYRDAIGAGFLSFADVDFSGPDDFDPASNETGYSNGVHYVEFTLDSHGFFAKPTNWVSHRDAPGSVQEAISKVILAHNALKTELYNNESAKYLLDRQVELFDAKLSLDFEQHKYDEFNFITKTVIDSTEFLFQQLKLYAKNSSDGVEKAANAAVRAIPDSIIAGTAVGGDTLSGAKGAILAAAATTIAVQNTGVSLSSFLKGALKLADQKILLARDTLILGPMTREYQNEGIVLDLEKALSDLQSSLYAINARAQEFDDAMRNYRAAVAAGDRLLEEREAFRQRASALIQGYRTRDAAFRIFRNEKLERYKTLFDLAARYSFLAANAYDYETGLLNTDQGKEFLNRIVRSRALGVVRNGEPQFAGSDTGDPGLSSALAEMKADWDAIRGRLGFNNPDAYGTTVSLRTENLRILPTTDGAQNWKNALNSARMDNILDDPDVRRYCMQLDSGNGLPVPGLVLEFETTITDGLNLFGQQRAAGDHWFSPSSFATKIFSVGVAFEGYKGMDDPVANSGAVAQTGGVSPSDPSLAYLDPDALGATPYIYLIPVGVDAMRSPPLGDKSDIRVWSVDDIAIPLPFNIGGQPLSTDSMWQSSDSLTENLFTIRKHQAFRPVSTAAAFTTDLYGTDGQLLRSQFTNNRLIGRSVWNSKWKVVIPGRELLNDPNQGLDRFIQTVRDVKLHFVTYSYSGN